MNDQEQPINIWKGDAFGRKADADFLSTFITERIKEREQAGLPRPYVLNLDAGWGRGKTYFLRRFQSALEYDGYLVAFVNAWRDDHADDPLIAVMSSIDTVVEPLVAKQKAAKKIWETVKKDGAAVVLAAGKGALKHWAMKAIGEGVEDVLEVLQSNEASILKSAKEEVVHEAEKLIDTEADELFRKFSRTQASIANFREQLAKLYNFLGVQTFQGHMKAEMLDCIELFNKFAFFSSRPLEELLDRSISSAAEGWVASRLEAELRSRGHISGRAFSVIVEYPKLIRSAGRLLPAALK